LGRLGSGGSPGEGREDKIGRIGVDVGVGPGVGVSRGVGIGVRVGVGVGVGVGEIENLSEGGETGRVGVPSIVEDYRRELVGVLG
jgi:hypothetical protein